MSKQVTEIPRFGRHDGRLGMLQLSTTVRFVNPRNPRGTGRWFVGNNQTQEGANGESLDDHTPGESVFHFPSGNSVPIPCDDKWKRIGRITQDGQTYDIHALHYDPKAREKYPSLYLHLRRIKKR